MPVVDIRLCLLVDTLCDQRNVPSLVTDLIAGYLDEHDLITIATVSPKLNEQANAIIYRNVVLDIDETARSRRKALLLLRTLLTSKTAATNIRNLSLAGEPLCRWRVNTPRDQGDSTEDRFRKRALPEMFTDLMLFQPAEMELYRKAADLHTTTIHPSDLQLSLPRLCLHIVALVTCLENLQIGSDYFRYPDFRDGLRRIAESGGFQNLQSCRLCLDILDGGRKHINAVKDWDGGLLTPFLVKGIKSVSTVMILGPEVMDHLRASSITKLVLHHFQTKVSGLDRLLANTPRLCYLEYHASVDYPWLTDGSWRKTGQRPSLGIECLFDALHHVSDTLTELVTSLEITEDSHHFHVSYGAGYEPPFRQRPELSQLKHLHTLSIPYTSVLGWTAKEDENWQWCKILPTSLRKITMSDNLIEKFLSDSWSDESLMPVFSGLLDWLATYRQEDRPPEFALLLLQSDTEFNEPVRQALLSMCNEHGILGSIKKLGKDRTRAPRVYMPRGGGGMRGRGQSRGRGTESQEPYN